jgi:hypothetical protein
MHHMEAQMTILFSMTTDDARTLVSFLQSAAVLFEADAKLCREQGHTNVARQFAKQARQARRLAAIASAAEDTPDGATTVLRAGS